MWANFRLPVWLLISCLKLLRHSLHRNNGTYLYKISPFYCWANVRTLFLTSFFTSFFASFVFISFLV